MAKGKKTGGRNKGAKNKRTLEREMLIGGEITPLQYMLSVMRNESEDKALRADMAKAAMPYLHPRRAPENAKGQTIPPMIYVTPDLEGKTGSR